MASCSEEITKTINAKINRVSYDEARGSVTSRFYNYKFKKDNNMLFEEVSLKSSPDVVIARDSDLYIRSDVKNFFTLNFSSADIESKLIEKRIDSLAALASLGFYLKVLFFKLTLDLRTDVAFFESSANIPMVMTLPVTASKRLHRKSGVLYSFQLGDAVSTTALKVDMPILKDKSIDGNFIQPGLVFCRDICQYADAFMILVIRWPWQLHLSPSKYKRAWDSTSFPEGKIEPPPHPGSNHRSF
jgi:hypothetical protein